MMHPRTPASAIGSSIILMALPHAKFRYGEVTGPFALASAALICLITGCGSDLRSKIIAWETTVRITARASTRPHALPPTSHLPSSFCPKCQMRPATAPFVVARLPNLLLTSIGLVRCSRSLRRRFSFQWAQNLMASRASERIASLVSF